MRKLHFFLILISSFALLNCANPKPDRQVDFFEILFKIGSDGLAHVDTDYQTGIVVVCLDSLIICNDRPQKLRIPEAEFVGEKIPKSTCVLFEMGNAVDLISDDDFVILNICF